MSDDNDQMAGQRPEPESVERGLSLLRPLRMVVDPVVIGAERIPDDRPLLLVGNHTIFGVLDVPFLYAELWDRLRIYPRALGHHLHFTLPGWKELVGLLGVVDGTRENCAALMRAGEVLLVFPGGAREAVKRKGERYALMWKRRLGFVRMALAHGCTIVPFAALGADDAFDVIMNPEEVEGTQLGQFLRGIGLPRELLPPLVRGIGPTPLPRPERLYFQFCEPIPTRELQGREHDDEVCLELRDRVRDAVRGGIEQLREHRVRDPERAWLPRLNRTLQILLDGEAR